MTIRVLALVVLLASLVLAANVGAATTALYGYASAYAPGVMEATIRYRLDNRAWRVPPPLDWYTAHGYIAAMDCDRVGDMRR